MKKISFLLLILFLSLTSCKSVTNTSENNQLRQTETSSSESSQLEELAISLNKNQENILAGTLIITNNSDESFTLILSDTEELFWENNQWEHIYMSKSAIYLITTLNPSQTYEHPFDFSKQSTGKDFTEETQFKTVFHFENSSNPNGLQKEFEYEMN